ncbi:MAG: 2Fe-2S iron-sulfur cluster-binding protein [Bacillota bacterium]|nr:2Fe-2S iron-sulfur cluster-binding protein [Bacillota bacterium]
MKKTITLTIDGKKIYSDEGTTILEAARQNGIEIPTLCYHPRLKPLGHCRLCIVKIKGLDRPVTSCDNPVQEGMVVTTDTPELHDMRRRTLELLLATHPYEDCLTCVRTGTCELQEQAYRFQSELPEQLEREVPTEAVSDNPWIVRDEQKCILCGRCIQVCRINVGRSVYSMIGSGVNTRVVPYRDGQEVSLEKAGCIFCGECVDVCPVAALTETGRKEGGREWELACARGVCIECSLGCHLERRFFDNNLIKVTIPEEGEKVSWLCRRGKFGLRERESAPLTSVQKFSAGNYISCDYGEAVASTAKALRSIKENEGGETVAVLAAGKLSNEEVYLLQKLTREILATENIDLGIEQMWLKAVRRVMEISGAGTSGPAPRDIGKAESIVIVGSGLEESHPVAAMAVSQASRYGKAAVVEISGRREPLNAWDGSVITVKKDREGAVLRAVVDLLKGKESSEVAKEAGIEINELERIVSLITGSNSIFIVTPDFFTAAGEDDIEALIAVGEMTSILARGQNRMLLLSRFSNAAGVAVYGGAPGCGPGMEVIPHARGLNRDEIHNAIEDGRIRGLLIFGADNETIGLKAPFTAAVCGDYDETPEGADYLFPAQQIASKEGCFVNAAWQKRCNTAVIENQTEITSEWRLICDLAIALGAKWEYPSLEKVREEMKEKDFVGQADQNGE